MALFGPDRVSFIGEASAQDKVKWRGVAHHRVGGHYNVWLWLEKRLPELTKGEVSLEILTVPELGLGGTEMLRVLRAGLVDIGDVNGSYVAGDWPIIEGTDLSGVATTPELQQAVADAWLKNVVQPREDIMGGKVLTNFYWNATFLFSKYPVNSLADIKGHKVRVFSANMAQWINALGGEPVQIVFAEVYSALQRGVIDSLVTGPDQVKGLSMWEVAPHMTAIGTTGAIGYIVVSRKSWDRLSEGARQGILAAVPEMQKVAWDGGYQNNEEGVALAKQKGMTLTIPAKPEWEPTFKKITSEVILPWWFERVGKEGKEAFKKHISPVTGHETN
jgi:TRAP-type C4-dicarboxylate transport system substrate-binding protein